MGRCSCPRGNKTKLCVENENVQRTNEQTNAMPGQKPSFLAIRRPFGHSESANDRRAKGLE